LELDDFPLEHAPATSTTARAATALRLNRAALTAHP